jgi:hypothetical protein
LSKLAKDIGNVKTIGGFVGVVVGFLAAVFTLIQGYPDLIKLLKNLGLP